LTGIVGSRILYASRPAASGNDGPGLALAL
jgi:hypothetical protein